MIWTIAKREAISLFRTPLAWALLAIAQFVLAYQFLVQIEIFEQFAGKLRALPEPPGITEVVVTPVVGIAALVMLFLIPILTMASFSGERRAGTLALLYSAPLTTTQMVLGKFLGLWALMVLMWLMIALMPLSLALGTNLDVGVYLAGVGALLLLITTYCAIGVFFSALFSQPAVAALATFGVLIGLWLIDWSARLGQQSNNLFAYLSTNNHFERLAGGLIELRDIAYFVILIVTALALSVWCLDGDRKAL